MKIGIIGTGAFSLAIADLLSKSPENKIILWSENKDLVNNFKNSKKVDNLFKDKVFSNNISLTNSYKEAIKGINILFLMTSISYTLDVCNNLKEILSKDIPICIGTKGIYGDNHEFAYQIVKSILPNQISLLSGPTFASDLINNDFVGFNIVLKRKKDFNFYEKLFSSSNAKLVYSHDFIGTSISASIKNIYAIGSGIIASLGYKNSTRACYLTAVFKEFEDILYHFNAKLSTLHSLSGIGDLFATCSSSSSRNYTLGYMIGKKKKKSDIQEYKENNTVEGIKALEHILPILRKKKVDAPIISIIFKIVFEGEDATSLIDTIKSMNLDAIF